MNAGWKTYIQIVYLQICLRDSLIISEYKPQYIKELNLKILQF
jgi:hypothetical protein